MVAGMRSKGLRALIGCLLAATFIAPAPGASAHHAESFTACRWNPDRGCERHRIYLMGDLVMIRGVVKPAHCNYEAELWRRFPCTGVWRRFKEGIEIHRHGGMVWRWRTDEGDVNHECSYGFQFRIPGHGRSNKVRLWVVDPGP